MDAACVVTATFPVHRDRGLDTPGSCLEDPFYTDEETSAK